MQDLQKLTYEFRETQKEILVLVIRKRTLLSVSGFFLVLIVVASLPLVLGTRVLAEKILRKNCKKDFKTYQQAKDLFESNHHMYGYLDGNNDNKPCQALIKK